jgi:prophage regulatory protein
VSTTKNDAAQRANPAQSLRTKEAARLLGIGVSTFFAWAKRPGFPPPRRLSARCVIYDQGELLRWRDAQTDVRG